MELKEVYSLVAILLVIGISVSIGLYVLSDIHTELRTTATTSNDNITLLNGTAVSLSNDELVSLGSNYNFSSTSQSLTEDTDFTLNKNLGAVTLINATYNNTQWNFTYTYTADTDASDAAEDTITALSDIPTWLAIIVVVVMAVIILGLIGKAFKPER